MKVLRTGYRPGMDFRSVTGRFCAAALLSGLLAGCGSDTEAITSANADTLRAQVDKVRSAVADGRKSAALSAASDLRSTIQRLAASGELNADDALVLLGQVDRIAEGIETRPTPTPKPTPIPTPVVIVDQPGGDKDDDEGNGEGNGKKKDRGKGNGDD